MLSPKVYQKQINDLQIEGKNISPQDEEEARIIFDELTRIELILTRIRHNVRMDTRSIRMDYITKIGAIKNENFKNRRRKTLKNKIKEKKRLIDRRDIKIAPYESIEYLIDDYLRQITNAKKYLQNYTEKPLRRD